MDSRQHRAEFVRRMHAVVEHIDQHLDETLELSALAAVAHFSPFHFHRLFAAWMGETLGDYLRRRRLEVAALRLIAQPRVAVLNIALSVGFGSAEAFARAFKTRFGCTATAWREQHAERHAGQGEAIDRKLDQVIRKHDQAAPRDADHAAASSPRPKEPAMKVKVIDRQPARVACLRYVGRFGDPIGTFWMSRVAPWMEEHDLFGLPRYGISHDDPDITESDKCRYDACVEVPEAFIATGDSFISTIPGGKYAVTRFKGTSSEIGAVWSALLRDWLPASGLQLDARPFFEFYPVDVDCDEESDAFECDLMIPVAPL